MPTMTDRASDQFAGQARKVADRLRDLADEVDRAASKVDRTNVETGHAVVASEVVHTVMWGMANLSLDNLASTAAETDKLARLEAAEEQSGG